MAVIARYSAKEHVKGPLRSILFTALTLAIPYAEKATAQVYINDGLDGACQRIVDTGGSSIEAKVSSQCNEDPWNVTLYTRFFGSSTAAGDQGGASRSLVLGGVLYVNGGQVGINDVLNKTYSLRMGSVATMNAAVGANAIAIGSSQSSAADATKASLATQASGARAIAIGAKTTASAVDAVAVGSGATANTGSFSVAIGANTSAVNGGVAVGGGSLVTVTDGAVALGLNSVASTGKGLAGYDPGTKTTSTDVSATWKSTLSAVSIGDVSGTTIKTRQLSGLAAGTSMTDAVNVAQLKVVDEIASKGWNLTASGVNSGKVAPGSSVDLKNTDKNLTITKAIGSNDVAFNLAKDVKIGTLTVGNTLLNTDGMAFGSNVTLDEIGLAIANGPSVTGSGIDAGGKVISHVAAGEVSATSTEAVNGSQLSAVQAQANQPMTFTGNEGSVARTLGQTLVISGESSTAGSYSGANLKSVVDAATGTLHLQLAESPQFGKVQINDGGKISGVAPGTAETDVPNMGQLKSISETVDKGWNLTASGANTSKVAAGATVDLKNTDGNLTISKTSDSNDVVFNLSKDFKVDGVTAGTTVVNNDGVQVGSDVALGKTGLTIANGPSVTGSGIDAGSQKITHVAAGTEETDAVNFSQLKSISETVDKGWNLAASGANTSKVAAGATVDLKNTDGNLTISKTSDSNDVVFNLSKDFKVDGVTAGTTVVNNDGVQVGSDVALGKTGLTIANGPSVTGSGIDAGGKVISHVAAGEVSATSTEAVNGSQLSAVQAQANQPMTFTGNEGSVARTLGQTLAISGESSTAGSYSGANLKSVVDAATGTLHLQLAESPQFGKVQINDGGKISGVAPGTAETDVPNMGQLKSISESVDKGWNLTAAGANTSKVVSGATVDLKNTDGNLTISKTSDSNDVVFNLSKDFKVDGVTAGTTVVNNDGVQVGSDVALGKTGLTIANGPSVTGSGIDAGGKVISHVAAGEVSATSTEAVNGSQLSAVQAQANQPMTFTGNEGSVARTLGQTLAISGESSTAGSYSGANLKSVVDAATGTLHLQLAESPQFGKVQINDGGKISGVAPGTAETDVPNMGQLKSISESVDKGWNLTAAGANTSKVVSGATVDLKNTDGNLTISKTSDSNDVVFNLSKDFKVDGVTAGTTVVNNDGVQVGSDVALGKTGLTIANGPSVTGSGIDAGGKVISHVAAGEVSATSTEAVNGSQLSAVQAQANQPMTFAGNEGSVARTLGQTLAISGESSTAGSYSGANLKSVVDAATGTLHLQLAESPQFGKVQINDGGKISGVAPGTAETDVPNMGQLKSISESVDKGWNLTAAGANTSKVVSGATVDLKNTDGNLTISKTSDSNDVVFNLSKDFKVDGVTAGTTVVNNDGVQVGSDVALGKTGLTIANGPSVTGSGIDAGGKVISHVAAGEVSATSTEAVNGSQLSAVQAQANQPMTFTGNEGSVARTLGQTLAISGESSTAGSYSGANLKSVVDAATGTLHLQLAESPQFGKVQINDGGKISGVAPGTAETDVPNMGQLKSISESVDKGWNLTAAGANTSKVVSGATVDLKNTDGNLTISKTSDSNDVVFNLSKDFKVDGVTAGTTVVNNDGVQVGSDVALGKTGLTIANGPSVTGSGIDAGGKVISHVAAGEVSATSTEAVNGSQLSAVQAQANQPMTFAGNEGSVARTLGQTLAISGESSTAGSYSGANLKSVVDAATGTLHLQLAESPQFGKVQINDGGKISGVAPGTAETDVPNMGQLKSISESVDKGWNLTAAGANTSKVVSGATVDLKNTDGNLTISKTSDSNDVVFNLSKDFKVDGVTAGTTVVNNDGVQVGSDVALGKTGLTIANGPSVTGSGIDAGGKVISHVAAGEVSATSTEAVNGSQLSAVQAQANQPMTFTGNEGSVARTLGQTLAISGESSTAGSYSGANLKSVVDAATGTLHLQLAESPQFGKVQINDGGKISGVAPGTAETDVPNMGQLKSISESVDKGWNLTAAGANTSKVVSGATVDLKNTDGNLTISKTSDSNDVVFNLSKDLKENSVTVGSTVVNDDGVKVGTGLSLDSTGLVITGRSSSSSIKTLADGESTVTRTIVNGDGVKIGDAVVLNAVGLEIVGGPSITLTGIDAGSQKITHVAAGTEETDAVNFSQLKSISESVGKGWNLTVSGANASKVAAGATVDLKNTDGNLTISKSSDSNDVVFNLSKDFKVDGVTAGNTVMNNDGVKVGSDVALGLTGLVIMGGPSVTNTGINAGNQKIINVAAAMADTDAVNFAQLKHAVANVSVKPAHYYSTNDGGTPGGNYDGDGATGIGSVAAGVGTQASGEGAVVVGAGAMGSGKGSVAMGRNASASADGSVVLGTGAKDGGRGAENYIGKYSGVENKTVGTVSLGDATKGETRTISNVADAKEATDAVNLRQLDYVAQQVNHYTDDKMQGLSDIQNVFKINNSKSSSSKGIALNAMAIGTDATASGVDGVAMGNNANVSANNAVAIGANSVADRPNTVSMGSAGSQRQVTNVAPATTETDAVNLGQLNQGVITAKQYTDGMVGNLRRDGNGGVAAAIATANLPQAYVPGRGMASLGVSSYQGQSAIAVGVSAVSDSGHWVFKFSGTTNTRSQAGVGAGVGYQW
ncbi:YadA-like family protein [Xylella taiwanensis]|nr:YadA-like family protein [Xylella taiwanensis]QKD99580.1 adhesin [Xylella taiwanensis]UFM94756.1 YadA-like family protein [Xylella taiwanensis]UFN03329.1 YadA-like family protein [Xylella taiwanensis]UFN07959.1 YadA-like family protein [Xylella taiwanensis]UFN10250.1 YadA-like family protein [Xylella taiwanensis]